MLTQSDWKADFDCEADSDWKDDLEWKAELEAREAQCWVEFEAQLLHASNGHAVTTSDFQTVSNEESWWLNTLPSELKIVILCYLDEVSLSALIRTSPAYNDIFKNYRSEIHTAVTLNTLRAREIDVQLQERISWVEVASTIPKPHSNYLSGYFWNAIRDYHEQCLTKAPIRMSSKHCMALCSLQDVIAWGFDDNDDDKFVCFGKSAVSPNRLPIHTYTLINIDASYLDSFWESLYFTLKYEDPWFRSRQARHNFASEEDEEQWIRRERKEPMDRSTFGPFRFSTTMIGYMMREWRIVGNGCMD